MTTGVEPRALDGVRVLELATWVAGPYAARLLADLGAEVLKVEPPGGDPARRAGCTWDEEQADPPWPALQGDTQDASSSTSSLFLYVNTDKRSLVLDLAREEDRQTFRRLAQSADLLVEDRPPGELERLGLGYEALREINPALIMASLTPYGATGPHALWRSYPLNTFHAGGEGYVLPGGPGWAKYPDRPPLQGSPYLGEYRCGLTAALASLIALFWRRAGGTGQHLDISKQEALAALSRVDLGRFLSQGQADSRGNRSHPMGGLVPCRDGFIELHPVQEHEWQGLLKLMGSPAWASEEAFARRESRHHHKAELDAHILEWTLRNDKEEIFHRGQALASPCGPVYTPLELLQSEHLRARGFFVPIDHPETGPLDYAAVPYRFSATAAGPSFPAPALPAQFQVSSVKFRVGAGETRNPKLEPTTTGQALGGIRVIDFSWVIAGPYAAALLAMMGAQVIRIESRRRPDMMRGAGHQGGGAYDLPTSPPFQEANLNKLGLCLDLGKPRGKELARALVAISDVVVENFRPGVMDRLGLGYADLSRERPGLVMFSGSTCGATGPLRDYTGYASIFSALGGLDDATGYPDGEPTEYRGSIDLNTGTTGAFALMAALLHRQRTGQGQHVDLSAWESMACLVGDRLLEAARTGRNPPRLGNEHPRMAPHNVYPSRGEDRWVSIAVGTQEEWLALCAAAGHPEWAADGRLAEPGQRWLHRAELDGLLAGWTRERTCEEATEMLQAAGVAAAPSMSARDLAEDPHLLDRGYIHRLQDPLQGEVGLVGAPWRFSRTPAQIRRPAPVIGQDTPFILREILGLGEAEIARLEEEQVLY